MTALADIDPDDLAYVRRPVGRLGREHYATGKAPAGSDADTRAAWAVVNANHVASRGTRHWTGGDGSNGG
jgi:hypothetical protein